MILFRNFMGIRGSKQSPIVPGLGQGRAAFKVTATSPDMEVCAGDGRPPGSSGKSRLKAPAQFGAKKDIHIPHSCQVKQNRWSSSLCCGAKAIIEAIIQLTAGPTTDTV